MKSLFRGAFFRGVSVSALAISLAACTANPQPLDRPGDVPQAFTAPTNKSALATPTASWNASVDASCAAATTSGPRDGSGGLRGATCSRNAADDVSTPGTRSAMPR
jgi:hypothetical protein